MLEGVSTSWLQKPLKEGNLAFSKPTRLAFWYSLREKRMKMSSADAEAAVAGADPPEADGACEAEDPPFVPLSTTCTVTALDRISSPFTLATAAGRVNDPVFFPCRI